MGFVRRPHLPMRQPEDVRPYLGAPDKYRDGRSAKLIAEAWFSAAGDLPAMIRWTLDQIPRFAGAELVDAFLERCIELGDGLRPSQADVLAILGCTDGLAVMAVEGKVDESFGRLVAEWLVDASPQKHARLSRLANTLGLTLPAAAAVRYQLIHRTASAIYEAHRFRAKIAVMMVHSFDPNDAGLRDFKHFGSAIGMPEVDATRLSGPITCEGVDLYLGWSADRASNEDFVIVDGRKTDAELF